jgi:hypothetical protein
MNPNHTTADILGLAVEYRGLNGVGQHCFSNGSPLVTHVFHSIQDAVGRFGARINLQERHYRMSVHFKAGYADAVYEPKAKDRGAIVEYGLGHIKRLIEQQAQREAKRVEKPFVRLPQPPPSVRVTAPTPAIAPKPNPVADMVARALAKKPEIPRSELLEKIVSAAHKVSAEPPAVEAATNGNPSPVPDLDTVVLPTEPMPEPTPPRRRGRPPKAK